MALKAIRLKPKEVVIIPSINFIAAANVSKMIGAKIFFADVDSRTGQMSPENLIDCIKINKLKKLKLSLQCIMEVLTILQRNFIV